MYELHCQDALQFMATLPDGAVDAIITDLPYGTTACSWDEIIPFAPMWEQVKRVLKPRGVFVTTASQPFTSALVMSNLEWFKYCWVWNKVNHITGYLDAKTRPLRAIEEIVVFGDGQGTFNPQMRRGEYFGTMRPTKKRTQVYGEHDVYRDANGLQRYPQTLLTIPADERGTVGRLHPTQKPVALYAYLIRTYTNPGDTVLDFCCGSGTTGVAAVKEDRNFIGNDNDPGYFAIASKRLADAAAQLRLPLG